MNRPTWLAALATLLIAVGCGNSDTTTSPSAAASPSESASVSPMESPAASPSAAATQNTTVLPSADQAKIDPQKRMPKDGDPVAVLDTEMGKIVIMFFPDKAPGHVANFEGLVQQKFYDGTKFHRTMPGFMIQGGDPNTKGTDTSSYGMGGPGYMVKNEFNDIHHSRGIVSMARSSNPDSAGSQFFIVVADHSDLDGQYTVFGKVVKGMDVADKIVALPSEPGSGLAEKPVAVKSITIEKWPVK